MNLNIHRLSILSGVAVLVAAILACNASTTVTPGIAPTNAPANTATAAPTDTPTLSSGDTNLPAATPTNTETATSTPIVHVLMPGEPPGAFLSQITDQNSSALASEHRANGGENFSTNLFERPFSSNAMDYFPDLDIINTKLFTRCHMGIHDYQPGRSEILPADCLATTELNWT